MIKWLNAVLAVALVGLTINDALDGAWGWFWANMAVLTLWLAHDVWHYFHADCPDCKLPTGPTVLAYEETTPTPDWLKRGYEPVETPGDQSESSSERCGNTSCSCNSWGRS